MDPPRKQHYREGDWLWIPLRRPGFHAVARIARVAPGGDIITIYGFGPPRSEAPSSDELDRLEPASADLVGMAGDMGIQTGDWKVLSHRGRFDRERWPMPPFAQWDESGSRGLRLDYVKDAPNTKPVASVVSIEEARRLPRNRVSGYKAFEVHLSRALGLPVKAEHRPPDGRRMTAEHLTYFRSQGVAKSAANQMLKAVPGASVEVRRSGDKWLVLLSHQLMHQSLDFDMIVDRLKRIAAQRSGEYDGWERDT